MKYIIGFLFILAITFGNSSCQKEFVIDNVDSSLITLPGGVMGSFTANIDGKKFTADKASGASLTLGTIVITGISNSGETIILSVADSGVHMYTFDIESTINVGIYTKDNEYSYGTVDGDLPSQSGGTLSITSIDKNKKTISGKFSMTVYRQSDKKQKKITEGVFNNIAYDPAPVQPASSLDTFRVKIDGSDFPAYSIVGLNLFNTISITVNNQAGTKTIGLIMPSDVKPGTYNYSPSEMKFFGQYNSSSNSFLVANSGTITILEHNTATKRIKGNFNFEAKEITGVRKANLTAGYFSVTYK